jgi:purine-binding chemotaxis protein CheW
MTRDEETIPVEHQMATEESFVKKTAPPGKYIIFKLGNEEYAFEILKVREIIGMMDITRVPEMDKSVLGVINLRGKVNPVVDLRQIFGMTETVTSEQTVIMIVQLRHNGQTCAIGVLVDQVLEVLNIPEADIEPPPSMRSLSEHGANSIMGVARVDRRIIMLLDIDATLSCTSPSSDRHQRNDSIRDEPETVCTL